MPSPRPEAISLGERYRLALAYNPRRGPAGERLSRGIGSSIEFQDRRDYAPGDDVRHLDWRALARTDTLFVRQYREEILPRMELLVDCSASMALDEKKAALTLDLATVLTAAAHGAGFQVAILLLGNGPERVAGHDFLERGVEFTARAEMMGAIRLAAPLLRPGNLRVLLSDFLSPHTPEELLRTVARGAGGLACLQVLSTADADPPRDVAQRLVDSESAEELDLVLDDRVRSRYLTRLERLVEGLRGECLRHGGAYLQLQTDRDIEGHCRGLMTREGFLTPA